MRLFPFLSGLVVLAVGGIGRADSQNPHAADVAAYDSILSRVAPGERTIALGDMIVPVESVQLWRDQLAGGMQAQSAGRTGVNLWPGGNVYYAFNANVTAAHQTAALDAMAEWAMFAHLNFIARISETDYIMISDGGGEFAGGSSAVGKIGGAQPLNINSSSWNRGTIDHELGHALGLIHEHQRGDGVNSRDNFVTINFSNVPGGASDGNFILVPTATGHSTYDFLSVMHYARKQFAVNPALDTITPKAAYTPFGDIMGTSPDRILSRGDRDGMAAMYGAGPALSTVVTNTQDSGPGSLRAAIYKAFDIATDTPGATPTITFNIPGANPHTIQPSDRLPAPGPGTTIDATAQTIVLNGSQQPPLNPYGMALRLSAANVTVKGLIINGCANQGILMTTGATGDSVVGCFIGTNAAGTAAVPNAFAGIEINGGATGNHVGGTTAAARNVISGNTSQGILIRGAGTQGNFVTGNYLGLNAAGTAALPNGFAGIEIGGGATGNTVGGNVAGAGNVISGNTVQGVFVNTAGTSGNVVLGNYIGTNPAGTAAIANVAAGVEIAGGATANTVGGTTAGAGNLLSGNTTQGVKISDAGTTGNIVSGNVIGLNSAGTGALPNANSGIGIFNGATFNTIGGTAAGAGNIISGNTIQGIYLTNTGTNSNTIAGNWIGLNAAGTAKVSNGAAGIEISNGPQSNSVGGTTAAARNVISGNAIQGVFLAYAGTTGNFVSGNYIGTNPAGTAAIANAASGVEIYNGATANIIGGAAPGAGNVISGNTGPNVLIDFSANNNTVAGNFIGLNAAGTAALVNGSPGVQMWGGAQGNVIGGTNGGRNFIAGNNGAGVTISGHPTDGNTIVGNSIGIAPTGAIVANAAEGIALFADGSGGPQGNTIGGSTPGAANFISGNTGPGVGIYNSGTINNRISGNSIFANGGLGIDIWGDGITPNDSGDGDAGPNNLQNFPLLTSAVLGVGTTITGTLNSTASTTFRIEFFASAAGDASGSGEGQNFVGATSVTTNPSGNATIALTLPATIPAGRIISATATDPDGNTSEFAHNVTITATDTDADGIPDAWMNAVFGHPTGMTTDKSHATDDADGDGLTNLQEFRAGSDARNATSGFRLIAPTISGGDRLISLPSVTGFIYRIDYANDLLSSNHWHTLADQIAGTGSTITITDPGSTALPVRFYRAVVLP